MVRVTGNLSASMINEAGYSWSYGAILSTPTGLDATVNSPDIKVSLPFPVTLGRVPALSFGGAVAAVTGYGPYNEFNRNQNFFDNWTKIAGKHTFKAGFTPIHYTKQENAATANTGTFNFATTPGPTGTSTFQQA